MDPIDKLAELFREFPGIGPRQSKRFVYFLLQRNSGYLKELTEGVAALKETISQCPDCLRYFPKANGAAQCTVCRNSSRDHSMVLVVEKDVDLDAIEKSRIYHGYYFVLGGTLSLLDKDPAQKIRRDQFLQFLKKRKGAVQEIVLALSATTEGDYTTDYLRGELERIAPEYNIKVSTLGRGLSTGTELEYSDNDTIKSAFKNRG